ncbi:hypothetical protein AX17_002411 [Amanita inopinata Kibby_2008]|nr:hypothetical protein AX17_002411 [Amanita inopinata Kibby_2008]
MQSSSPDSSTRRDILNKLFRMDKTKKGHALPGSSATSSSQHSAAVTVVPNISHLTRDFATLAVKHEPAQAPSGVGFPQMKAVLQGFASLADGASHVPGLKTVFQLGLQIIQTAEMAKSNKQMCYDVAQHAYELLNLMKDVDHPNDPNLQDISNALTNELNSVYVAINILATRNWLGHAFHANEDKDAINKCEKFLDWSLNMLQVRLQLLQYKKINASGAMQPVRKMTDSRQIPTLPAAFCGRTFLIEQVKGIILQTKGANLAITGAGGMGKTTLAVALLHDKDIKSHFGTHLHFVSCETIKSAGQLVNGLLITLGVPLNTQGEATRHNQDPRRVLHDVLSTSGNMLIVLDNFETPWNESAIQAHVHAVLMDIAALDIITLIITTRVAVLPHDIYWEQFLPEDKLPPLDLQSARAVFLQEARITVEGQESRDLDVLLHEVDCIPLAVSLLSRASASRKSPTQLLRRWREEYTSMLRTSGHSRNTKQNSVEVSVEVSVAPFRETNEIRLLALLSFLPAGIQDWESELPLIAVGLEAPQQLVHNLIAVSLVQDSNGLLHMLSPIQHYIRRKYGDNCTNEFRHLSEYFVQLILGDEKEVDNSSLLDQAKNIAAVLIQSMERFPARMIFDAAYCYSRYLLRNHKANVELADTLLSEVQKKESDVPIEECLVHVASVYGEEYMHEEAKNTYNIAYEKYMHNGHVEGTANCLKQIGSILYFQDNYGDAMKKLEIAYQQYTAIGNKQEMANCLSNIGDILYHQNNYAAAMEKTDAAYMQYTTIGDQLGMADCLKMNGDILYTQGSPVLAMEKLESAHVQYNAIGSKAGMADCLRSIGDILYSLGKYVDSMEKLEAAHVQYTAIGSKRGIANCLRGIGNILYSQKDFEGALEKLEAAHTQYATIGDKLGVAGCLKSFGDILCSQRNYKAALEKFDAAHMQYTVIGNKWGIANCLIAFGDIFCSQDNYAAAMEKFEAAHMQYTAIGNKWGMAICLKNIAKISYQQGNNHMARLKVQLASELYSDLGKKEQVAVCAELLERFSDGL